MAFDWWAKRWRLSLKKVSRHLPQTFFFVNNQIWNDIFWGIKTTSESVQFRRLYALRWRVADTPTFHRVVLDWLLEGGDVTEGAEKQDHFVLLVPDGSDLHEKPNWHPCGTRTHTHIQDVSQSPCSSQELCVNTLHSTRPRERRVKIGPLHRVSVRRSVLFCVEL